MRIFGVTISNFSKQKINTTLISFLNERTYHHIATVNPEFLLEVQKNKKFQKVLDACDLKIADGAGLHLGAWRVGKRLQHRYPGIDLMWDLLAIANERRLKIFLIAHQKGLSTWTDTASAIAKDFPHLIVSGTDLPPHYSTEDVVYVANTLRNNNHEIIFCNFGAPQQEFFLSELKNAKIQGTRIAIGVGGSFDYITKILPRAPRWMQEVGLEWLYRLAREPRYRIKRIWRAVVIFPIKLLFTKHGHKK